MTISGHGGAQQNPFEHVELSDKVLLLMMRWRLSWGEGQGELVLH